MVFHLRDGFYGYARQRIMQLTDENEPPSPHLCRRLAARGCGPVTLTLMVVCAGLFVYGFCFGYGKVGFLSLTNFDFGNAREISLWRGFLERISAIQQLFPEVKHGQVWRLVGPILLHINFLQLFFNLLWLWWLGNTIEMRRGSLFLLILIIGLAAVSNVTIYLIDGIGFGGLSGVTFGLAGYAGVRGKLAPQSLLSVHFFTAAMMGIWGLICVVGVLGPIINAAHISGLLAGMAWGLISSIGDIKKKFQTKSPIRLSLDAE